MSKEEKRKPLILIVEDTEDWRNTLKDLLEPLDVKLEMAVNLTEGLRIAESHPPDSEDPIRLVILDMRIPYAVGDKAEDTVGIKYLQEYGFLHANVPIIVFTAYDNYDNCIAAIKAGAYYYLPKSSTEPGIDSSQKLLELCNEILFPPEKPQPQEPELPDEKWFDRHHEEVRSLYAGKSVVFLPEAVTFRDDPAVSSHIIDGVRMIAADSYSKLRRYILDQSELRKILPLIVLIEGGKP